MVACRQLMYADMAAPFGAPSTNNQCGTDSRNYYAGASADVINTPAIKVQFAWQVACIRIICLKCEDIILTHIDICSGSFEMEGLPDPEPG